MSDVFTAAGGDDDDFGAFAAAPPPVDPFAVDDPFADIVHAPSSSLSSSSSSSATTATAPAATAATTTTTAATAGSPLLSFSPVAAVSDAPFADVFAPPAEAELLSFSPVLHSTSAPSSLSAFLLDSPAPANSVASSSSSGGIADATVQPQGFSLLPPPRAATAPTLSPVLVSLPKAASFPGHVSLGELLSFSPVASAGASFTDSFGSSSGAAATTGTSVFDDDELFSLSTVDMALELPAATAPEPLDVYAAAFSSPAALSSSTVESGSETANTPVGGRSADGNAHASAFPSPVASMSPAFGSGSMMMDTPSDAAADTERMSISSSRSDSRATEEDVSGGDLAACSTSVESKWDGEDAVEGAGSSFADHHDFAGADLALSRGGSDECGVASASSTSNTVEDAFGDSDDAFSAFDEIAQSDAAPTTLLQSSAASFQETKTDGSEDVGADAFGGDGADDNEFGDFGETTTAAIGGFGDFAQPVSGGAADDEDDDFGDFAQSSSGIVGGGAVAGDDDDFGDFGDFVQSSGGADASDDDDGFSDFAQPSSFTGGSFGAASHDDDFGDFSSPPAPTASGSFVPVTAIPAFPAVEPTSDLDLETFFSQAFPVQTNPAPLEAAPLVPSAPTRSSFKDLFQDKVCANMCVVWEVYQ